MLTITLPPELERAVNERAKQQGTTPEIISLDALREKFPPLPVSEFSGETLADFLGDFIGCLDSGEIVPGGARMSEDSSEKFAAGMAEKRKAGRL